MFAALIQMSYAGWFSSDSAQVVAPPEHVAFDQEQAFDEKSNQIQTYDDDMSEAGLETMAFAGYHGAPVSFFSCF